MLFCGLLAQQPYTVYVSLLKPLGMAVCSKRDHPCPLSPQAHGGQPVSRAAECSAGAVPPSRGCGARLCGQEVSLCECIRNSYRLSRGIYGIFKPEGPGL